MKYLLLIFISLSTIYAQDNYQPIQFGTELDIFPYATGGYYVSATAGRESLRARIVMASANQPQFILPEGFDKNSLTAYAVILDYFPLHTGGKQEGLWIGGGYEYWNNNVRNYTERNRKSFANHVLTAGAGYNYFLTNRIFINPWTAVHFIVAGDRSVPVGNKTYTVPVILPELSLKFGIVF